MKIHFTNALLCCLLILSVPAETVAKVSPEQAAKLGVELTPFGATQAGDGDQIPAWQDVTQIDTNEQPLFTITHANHHQYLAHLTAGQVALFETYPETFSMAIYPSHRTFNAPKWVTENTQKNATQATLNEQQTGIQNSLAGIPFPLPQSATEVYFNHITRWRGQQLTSFASDAVINDQGNIQLTTRETLVRFDYYLPDGKNNNRLFSALSKITAPANQAGSGGLVLEPLDQIKESRSAWLWDQGRRRVIRAPQLAYDQPVNSANGLRTADDTDMINGSPDRFNWHMLEPRMVYIPYNNDRLIGADLSYAELLKPGHINPQYTRYELHRVWVIRATLKAAWRHVYSQRDFYLDEDSWSVVIADQYDKQGKLFRVSLSYLHQDHDLPGTVPVINAYHDLNSRQYHVMGLQNEAVKPNAYPTEPAKDSLFTSNGLKRFVR